ncbi:hypothetical protein SAMN04487931_108184 [Desulfobacula phenolica]|uniref:Uncharacterized protein n=1 Tax=Desulfobacula phenolica TaxID=90732 RepID=A0A1H2IGU5_9BACT|nr:hypothetical protein SAMN04487931_108184 [Desulfobacula phenolica]
MLIQKFLAEIRYYQRRYQCFLSRCLYLLFCYTVQILISLTVGQAGYRLKAGQFELVNKNFSSTQASKQRLPEKEYYTGYPCLKW